MNNNSQIFSNDQPSFKERRNESQMLNSYQSNSKSEQEENYSNFHSQSLISIPKSQQTITINHNNSQYIDTEQSHNSYKSQTQINNKTLTKSQFHIASHSVYKKYEEPAQLNRATNFLPQTNHITSTELLLNSGIYNKQYNENDSTKATLLINQNQSIIDPSFNSSMTLQKPPLKYQLDIIDEELNLEKKKKELQKYKFEKEEIIEEGISYNKQRRASEILLDSIKQQEEERSKPKPKEIHIAFSPYDITRQDVLIRKIEQEKKKLEYENKRNNAELNEKATKHANELLEFLGLKQKTEEDEGYEQEQDQQHRKLVIQPTTRSNRQSLNSISEEDSEQHSVITKTNISTYSRKTNNNQSSRIIDVIAQMNSKTPQQQKIEMIKGLGGVSSVNVKSIKDAKSLAKLDFEQDDKGKKKGIKRIINPSQNVSQVSIQLPDNLDSNEQTKGSLEYLNQSQKEQGDGDESESPLINQYDQSDTQSVKKKMDQFIDRRTLKSSFQIPLRYSSSIIQRAFSKQGQTYISKWLSQSSFQSTQLGMEEDIDQTVIKNAGVGQQIVLIESKQQKIQGRLNRRGKFRKRKIGTDNEIEDTDDENEEDIIKNANEVDTKLVQRLRMKAPANIESNKEKLLAQKGREKQIKLNIPESKWEQHQIMLGKRKVRFQNENDLYQPDLDVGPDTIFQNPSFFRGFKNQSGTQSLTSIGQSVTSFAQIEDEPEKKNLKDLEQKIDIEEIFNEIYYGGDQKDSKFYKKWKEFYIYKEKFRDAFDRLDGLKYQYKPKEEIEQKIRNNQTYEDMISQEKEDKAWYPDHEPQTNPPDVLKDFVIEPNILVYTNKILDLDRNYKKNNQDKEKSQVEQRRQGKIGIADEKTPAYQLSLLMEGKDPKQNNIQPVFGQPEGNRELFDFMYQNTGNLPFIPMNKIVKAVDDTENKRPKISELERILFEQTPMLSTNIYTNKTMFRVKEADEYENEIKQKQRRLISQLQKERNNKNNNENQQNNKVDSSQIINQDLSKNKAQFQINNMTAAMNIMNLQYTNNEVKQKSIMKGIESLAEDRLTFHHIQPLTKNNLDATKNNFSQPTKNMINNKTTQNKNQLYSQPNSNAAFEIQSLQSIQNDDFPNQSNQQNKEIQQNQQQEQQQQTNQTKVLEIKTIQDLNNMYTTPQQIISKTLKSINEFQRNKPSSLHNTEFNFRRSQNFSRSSIDSNPNDFRTVVKNQYEANYGSVLTNAKLDYNTPQFYHQREAEQGLFYLSKQYRDYFEPARDVFAEKEGWDILNQFAANPKNMSTNKPAVHNYSQQKDVYNEDDILTAFHGIQVMENNKKLMADVNSRNEQNFKRRIYYNQSQ